MVPAELSCLLYPFMPLRIKCPTGHTLIVPEDRAGRTLRCPRCEQAVVVPGKASGSVTAKASGGRQPPDDAPSPPAVILPPIDPPPTEPTADVAPPPVVAASDVAPPPIAVPPPAVSDIVPAPPVIVALPAVAAPSLALQAGSEKVALPAEPQPEPLTEQQESVAFAAVAVPDEPEPPPRKPPEPPPLSALKPTLPGVVPDYRRVLVVYQLAAAVVAAALFSIAPAAWDIVEYWRIPDSHFVARWALGLLFLGVVQVAYAVYVVQLPDWGSVWVVTLYSLALAALYAMVLGLTLISPEDGAIVRFLQLGDKIAGSKAALWCLCMVSVATLLAFFAGRLSVRWHHAEQVLRSVRG